MRTGHRFRLGLIFIGLFVVVVFDSSQQAVFGAGRVDDNQVYLPVVLQGISTNTTTLFLWDNGLLDPQPIFGTWKVNDDCISPCDNSDRWTASLAGDFPSGQFNLTGIFDFNINGASTVPVRIILAHHDVEQTLAEYDVNLISGHATLNGFSVYIPDPKAAPGDTLILEIDRRGMRGSLSWYFGGANSARLVTPVLNLPVAGNQFTQHTIDDSFSPILSSFNSESIYPVDLNGDGNIDFIGSSDNSNTGGAGTLYWLENDGTMHFTQHIIDTDFYAKSVSAVDVDGDGATDIMAVGGVFAWWKNEGNGNFTKHLIETEESSSGPILGIDLDKDGDMDLIVDMTWWENDGHENFVSHNIDWYSVTSLSVVDPDKDGDLDMIGAGYGFINWWENNGNQIFTRHIVRSAAGSISIGGIWDSVVASDVNKDGKLEIVSAIPEYHEIAWWENDGNQNFTKHFISSSFTLPESIFAADINGDGNIDLLGSSGMAGSGPIAWWENLGNQVFIRHIISMNGAGLTFALDLDRDGNMDFLAINTSLGRITWWENAGK